MKWSLIVLIAAIVNIGCATTSLKEFKAPDGSAVKTVKCTSDTSKCFEKASQSCPVDSSYLVKSSESHMGGVLADIFPGPVTWYSMTYSCGVSDGKMPDFAFTGERMTFPMPVAPTPVIIKQKPTYTNCSKVGDYVNCSTY